MESNYNSALILELQKALINYEQSLLRIADGVDQHGFSHKAGKSECDTIVREIRTSISRARRTTSIGVEAFTEISVELGNREAEIQHMEARIKLNGEMLHRAQVENASIKILTSRLKEQRVK